MPPNPRDNLPPGARVPHQRVTDAVETALKTTLADYGVTPARRGLVAAAVVETLSYFRLMAPDVEPMSSPRSPASIAQAMGWRDGQPPAPIGPTLPRTAFRLSASGPAPQLYADVASYPAQLWSMVADGARDVVVTPDPDSPHLLHVAFTMDQPAEPRVEFEGWDQPQRERRLEFVVDERIRLELQAPLDQ